MKKDIIMDRNTVETRSGLIQNEYVDKRSVSLYKLRSTSADRSFIGDDHDGLKTEV